MIIIAEPKTQSSIRTIPLPRQLIQLIKSSKLPMQGYLLTGSYESSITSKKFFSSVKFPKQIFIPYVIRSPPDV